MAELPGAAGTGISSPPPEDIEAANRRALMNAHGEMLKTHDKMKEHLRTIGDILKEGSNPKTDDQGFRSSADPNYSRGSVSPLGGKAK